MLERFRRDIAVLKPDFAWEQPLFPYIKIIIHARKLASI